MVSALCGVRMMTALASHGGERIRWTFFVRGNRSLSLRRFSATEDRRPEKGDVAAAGSRPKRGSGVERRGGSGEREGGEEQSPDGGVSCFSASGIESEREREGGF